MPMTPVPHAVFDSVSTAVIVVDQRRRVVHANRAALDLLGSAAMGRDIALSLPREAGACLPREAGAFDICTIICVVSLFHNQFY